MNTTPDDTVPAVPLRHRAASALRARDEAAARAEQTARSGDWPADVFRTNHAACVALAWMLGVHEDHVHGVLGPRGTFALTLVDDPHGVIFTFLAERTHPASDHGDAPAFRFQVLAACPACKALMPQREIRELADLGAFLDPRDPDAYAHIGIDPDHPGALDPEWHRDPCGLLLACGGPPPHR
ncbi:hypothetical protein LO772_08320 [Yinghuangia sp. ASG 101]|uniref:hypothetical protein n=1 Tax=Yinghuangia sp. ASG 101 TaxID=2896848 RepID=UPI001E4B773A|nr:hypothetical protein [Yinghuangia sp. ASG 101]UGQ13595.1 hypothetical protein LO772_08320 [Yinghuangia sp. ASG 101]